MARQGHFALYGLAEGVTRRRIETLKSESDLPGTCPGPEPEREMLPAWRAGSGGDGLRSVLQSAAHRFGDIRALGSIGAEIRRARSLVDHAPSP